MADCLYKVKWLDVCEWYDTEVLFNCLSNAFKYLRHSAINMTDIDENTREYLLENIDSENEDCDCYHISLLEVRD